MLQPVLYSVAVEQGLGKKVFSGRLFYATTAGGFVEHEIPINDYTRGQGLQVLEIIDRAVETGFLAGGAGRARLHVVRLPAGLRSARGGADDAARRASGSPISRR